MAGTAKKQTDTSKSADDVEVDKVEDAAPKLPDEVQPKSDTKADSDVTQASKEDEKKSDEPQSVADVTIGAVDDRYNVTVNYAHLPKADDVEVAEGDHDPTLVEIPGLGQFRNGTTTEVPGAQIQNFVNHLQVTGYTEVPTLPAGVTIEEGGN